MKLFNFGGLEIIFIIVIMIIFLGPGQVATLAGNLGRFIRKITRSEFWVSIWQTSREIRNLPKTLVEETGLQESLDEIQQTQKELQSDVDQIKNDLDEETKLQKNEINKTVSELNQANRELRKRATTGQGTSKKEVAEAVPVDTIENASESVKPKPIQTLQKKKR